ncbi:hypothetical protein [Paenibacillus albus]|uniref:Uncharacterized protein n=1 Tax=Paenibacillus albus TaxID=2495582 RepID=A0A3S9A709_9BACL|nr:hypothetical protein [Paenibacillus albus]AZN41542.1 hypothetical protein EJC50_19045 [Paenibacillus albus]
MSVHKFIPHPWEISYSVRGDFMTARIVRHDEAHSSSVWLFIEAYHSSQLLMVWGGGFTTELRRRT